jgi:hypothetical protein
MLLQRLYRESLQQGQRLFSLETTRHLNVLWQFSKYIDQTLTSWSDESGCNFISDGETFDIMTQITNCLTDGFADLYFSGKLEMSENQNSNPVGMAVVESLNLMQHRVLYVLFPFLDKLNPSPSNVSYHTQIQTVKDSIREMVRKRRLSGSFKESAKDLLDMLLRAQDPDTGATFTDEQILDELMSNYYSSVNPTGTAIQWFLYELSRNQGGELVSCAVEYRFMPFRQFNPECWLKSTEFSKKEAILAGTRYRQPLYIV